MITTFLHLTAAIIALVSLGLIAYTGREVVRADLGPSMVLRARLAGGVGILAAIALVVLFA